MEISPLPELGNDDTLIYNSFRRRFRPSSSILSPHLKRDKRATRSSKFFSEPASVVDPIAQEWITPQNEQGFGGRVAAHPDNRGYAYIAERLLADLNALSAGRRTS